VEVHSNPSFIALPVKILGGFLGRILPYWCAREKELWFLMVGDVLTLATLFGLLSMWYLF